MPSDLVISGAYEDAVARGAVRPGQVEDPDRARVFVAKPRHGLVTLKAHPTPAGTDGELTFVIAGAPDLTVPRVGGWQTVERDGLPPVRWWSAPGDGSLSLELALDERLVGGPPVARRLQVLAAMGRPHGGPGTRPPHLRIGGGDLPLAEDERWVVVTDGITLGDRVTVGEVLVRQDVTVQLAPYEPVDVITPVRPSATRRSAQGQRRGRVIESKKDDTLRTIAVRQLGSVGGWRAIHEWNPKLKRVDPDERLRLGTRVVLR